VERSRKAAVAKLAQTEARLRSATAQYNVQLRQHRDLELQIERCVIRAQKPGLVVYGRAGDEAAFAGGEERIREGATVRERQTILTIPETTHMGVKVKIHESYIKKIKLGQRARITVDAFADKLLEGEVSKVSVLPDSQNRWMNPDLKVYLTTISIDGSYDWLKPGMSTKVEIFVDHLDDVVYVPIQSVIPDTGKYVCYLINGGGRAERREVEVGQFNEEFIEIKRGIAEGETVLLHPPKAGTLASEEESEPTSEKHDDASRPASTNGAPAESASPK
jgi:multidrug efflux pump subunit AcrA (membrane-fusion protein)